MATPRVGALGVATTKGDLYVVDNNGNLERIPVGTDGQVLVADSTNPLGVQWKNSSIVSRALIYFDGVDAIYKQFTVAPNGLTANPTMSIRNTFSVIAFNDSAVQGLAWQNAMPLIYDGGNLTLNLYWVAATAIAGDVVWAAAFERDAAASSILADNFSALQTATTTAPGVLGNVALTSIAFTNAQAAAIAAGDPFRVFIQRTGTAAGDTMVGDAQLVRATLTEN